LIEKEMAVCKKGERTVSLQDTMKGERRNAQAKLAKKGIKILCRRRDNRRIISKDHVRKGRHYLA